MLSRLFAFFHQMADSSDLPSPSLPQESATDGMPMSELRKTANAQKDLDFLAHKINEAPAHFTSAYVRDGNPRWDTVGCNKAWFDKDDIQARKELLDA